MPYAQGHKFESYLIRKVTRTIEVIEIWSPGSNNPEYFKRNPAVGGKIREMQVGDSVTNVIEEFRSLTPTEAIILADLATEIKDED